MNLTLALALLGASAAAIWGGITDPAGGVFAGLRNSIKGQGNAKRTNVSGAAFVSDLAGGLATGATSSPGTTATSAHGAGPASGRRAAIVSTAQSWLGVPYVWGGTTRKGVDCSGLVLNVFKANGVSMPRVSTAQAAKGQRTTTPQPGDLVAFGAPVHHVGIFIGPDAMIHAPNSRGVVRVESVSGCAQVMRAPVQYRNIIGASTSTGTGSTVQA